MSASDRPASSRLVRPPLPNPSPARGEGLFSHASLRLCGLAGAVLGWRPDEFWAATPAELAAVLGVFADDEVEPATGGDLSRLMEMYPDG